MFGLVPMGMGTAWEYGRKRRREEIAHYFPKAISVQKDGWPSVRLLKELTSVLCCGTTSSTHSQQDVYSDLHVLLALQVEMGSDYLARWSLSFIFALFSFYSAWVKSHKLGLLTRLIPQTGMQFGSAVRRAV